MKVMLVAEHDGLELSIPTRAAITAAQQIADKVICLVAGDNTQAVAEKASQTAGVTAVWQVCDKQFAHRLAEPWAALIAEQAQLFTHVLMGASTFSKNVLPRAAALCEAEPIADVIQVISPNQFVRPIYAGDIWQTVKSKQSQHFLTIRPTVFEKATEADTPAVSIESIEAPKATGIDSQWVSQESHATDRPDLLSAAAVFSGGRGLQSKKNFGRLEKIADHYQAAIGASRAAVDAGMAPNDWQVGQTGQVVAPAVYVAIGISGATQHLAGMKDSKVVIAINKDPDAPIFSVADYGLVADAEAILSQWEGIVAG